MQELLQQLLDAATSKSINLNDWIEQNKSKLSFEMATEARQVFYQALENKEWELAFAAIRAAYHIYLHFGQQYDALRAVFDLYQLLFIQADNAEAYQNVYKGVHEILSSAEDIEANDLMVQAAILAADCAYFLSDETEEKAAKEQWLLAALKNLAIASERGKNYASDSWLPRFASVLAATIRKVNLKIKSTMKESGSRKWFESSKTEVETLGRQLTKTAEEMIPIELEFYGDAEEASIIVGVLAWLSYHYGSRAVANARLEFAFSHTRETSDIDTWISSAFTCYKAIRDSALNDLDLTELSRFLRIRFEEIRGHFRSRGGRFWISQILDDSMWEAMEEDFLKESISASEFFELAETTKARTLLDQMYSSVRDFPTAELASQAAEIERQMLYAGPELTNISGIPSEIRLMSPLSIGEIELKSSSFKRQSLQEVLGPLESFNATHDAGFQGEVGTSSLTQVMNALQPDEVLIEYLIPYAKVLFEVELWILAITSEQVQLLHIPKEDLLYLPLVETEAVFRLYIDSKQSLDFYPLTHLISKSRLAIQEGDDEVAQTCLQVLYRVLITPLLEHGLFPQVFRRWIIVPHGMLHYVPFAALMDTQGHYLIEDISLTVAPSASVWFRLQEQQTHSITSFLGFANPVLLHSNLSPLDDTEKELQKICKRLERLQCTTYTRENATKAALQKTCAGQNIVHFATHGEFPEKDAIDFHRILLSHTTEDDGRVHAEELRKMDLHSTWLVVLSICNGGLFRFGAGDEPYGLISALLTAGAKNILGTIWALEDKIGHHFMVEFYKHLLQWGPAEALQRTCKQFIQDQALLRHWAGFVLVGPGRLPVSQPTQEHIINYNRRGLAYYGLKEYQQAMDDFNHALALDPNLAIAYYNRGTLNFDLEDYQKAIEDFTHALILDPNLAEAYSSRGLAYQKLDEHQEAIADSRHAFALNPQLATIYCKRGLNYFHINDYQRAIEYFDRALTLDSSIIRAYKNRGTAYCYLNDYRKAIADFDYVLELDSTDFQTYNNRGLAYQRLKEYQRAIEDLDHALGLAPEPASIYYNRGNIYFELGDYHKAIIDFDHALQIDEETDNARAKRAISYYYLNEYQKAITYFEDAFLYDKGLKVSLVHYYYNMGYKYRNLGDDQKAIINLDRVDELSPQLISSLYYCGLSYSALKEYQNAIEYFSSVIELDSDHASAYYNRGFAYSAIEEYQQAVMDFDRVIYLNPAYTEAFFGRGLIYVHRAEYRKAIADFDSLLELAPTLAFAYYIRGIAYEHLKEYQQAIADYNRAIELDSKRAAFYNERGTAYLGLKEYQHAIEDFDRALALDPKLIASHNNRDLAYNDLRKYEHAIANFDHALALDQSSTPDYKNESSAYVNLKSKSSGEMGEESAEGILLQQLLDAAALGRTNLSSWIEQHDSELTLELAMKARQVLIQAFDQTSDLSRRPLATSAAQAARALYVHFGQEYDALATYVDLLQLLFMQAETEVAYQAVHKESHEILSAAMQLEANNLIFQAATLAADCAFFASKSTVEKQAIEEWLLVALQNLLIACEKGECNANNFWFNRFTSLLTAALEEFESVAWKKVEEIRVNDLLRQLATFTEELFPIEFEFPNDISMTYATVFTLVTLSYNFGNEEVANARLEIMANRIKETDDLNTWRQFVDALFERLRDSGYNRGSTFAILKKYQQDIADYNHADELQQLGAAISNTQLDTDLTREDYLRESVLTEATNRELLKAFIGVKSYHMVLQLVQQNPQLLTDEWFTLIEAIITAQADERIKQALGERLKTLKQIKEGMEQKTYIAGILIDFANANWDTRYQLLTKQVDVLLREEVDPVLDILMKAQTDLGAIQEFGRLRTLLRRCRLWGIDPTWTLLEMNLGKDIEIPSEYEPAVMQIALALSRLQKDTAAREQVLEMMQALLNSLTEADPPLFEAALLRDIADTMLSLPAKHLLRQLNYIEACYRKALAGYKAADRPISVAFVQHALGDVLSEQGRYTEALEPLRVAAQSFQSYEMYKEKAAWALSSYASALDNLGRSEEALATYAETLALLPESAPLLRNHAEALIHVRKLAEAEADLAHAVEIDGNENSPYLWHRRAQIAIARGESQLADQLLDELLKRDSSHDVALMRGQSAWLRGDLTLARQMLKQACEQANPGDCAAMRRELERMFDEHPELSGRDALQTILMICES